MGRKLIIYELNELPRRLLEYYILINPDCNFKKLKLYGKDLDTFTTDSGELHPWTTWPTFYRGVDNSRHKITSINQDIDSEEKYPPIWKILIEKNISIGIFGSLQSYPPIIHKEVKFFLPDTFSPDFKAFPKDLETFQKFNLKIVSNNSGEVRSIRGIEIKYLLDCIFNSSIRLNSVLEIIKQIFIEKINKNFKKRRSLIQPKLTFDIYFRNLQKHKPDFSTFFTNHLAGMMHYYWLDIFPDDFKNPYRKACSFNKNSVIRALDIADKQIGLLMNFATKNSYNLWIASSMGQQAIERTKFQKLYIRDFKKTISFLKFKKNRYKLLPSMYPDVNIESETELDIEILVKKLLKIKYSNNNKSIFKIRYRNNTNKINLIFRSNLEKINYLIYGNNLIHIKELGLEYGEDSQGTGYHTPKGILLSLGKESQSVFKDSDEIDTKTICSYILDIFKIKK